MVKKLFAVMFAFVICFSGACNSSNKDSNKSLNKKEEKMDDKSEVNIENLIQNETPVSDFEYRESESGIIITKYRGGKKKIIIPEIIENKKVIGFDKNVFSGNIVLQEITIPQNITVLDFSYFKNCDSLKSITCLGDIETFGEDYPELEAIEEVNLPACQNGLDPKMLEEYRGIKTIDLSGVSNIEILKRCLRLYQNKDMTLTISEDIFKTIEDSYVYKIRYGSWSSLLEGEERNYKGHICCEEHHISSIFSEQKKIYNGDVSIWYERGNIPDDMLKTIKEKSNNFYKKLKLSKDTELLDSSQRVLINRPGVWAQYGEYVYEGIFEAENSRVYVVAGLDKAYFHCFFKDANQQFCLATNTEKLTVNGRIFDINKQTRNAEEKLDAELNLFENAFRF